MGKSRNAYKLKIFFLTLAAQMSKHNNCYYTSSITITGLSK